MSVRLHICTCAICVLNTRVGVAKEVSDLLESEGQL